MRSVLTSLSFQNVPNTRAATGCVRLPRKRYTASLPTGGIPHDRGPKGRASVSIKLWLHEARNVTNCLPKSAQLVATRALQKICNAEDRALSMVKLRTKVTRGADSPAAALAMEFKLVESAQARWGAVNAPRLVALVRAGARFERGVLVERERTAAA